MRAVSHTALALLQIGVVLGPAPAWAAADLRPGRHRKTKSPRKPQHRAREEASEDGASGDKVPGDKVLIFWACGSSKDTVQLIKKNVQHARKQLPHVSVFLAHYDHMQSVWRDLAGKKWYEKNVDAAWEQEGYKFQLLKMLVHKRVIDVMNYDWVWVLDEDADFQHSNLPRMLELATESGSLISTPAFTSTTGSKDMSYPFQQPRSDCRIRYAPVVEVTFPLFRSRALQDLLTQCDHCMGRKTVWGFCRMWCSWSARRLGKDKDKACAILDGSPIVHQDFRTLNGKYEAAKDFGLWGAIKAFDGPDFLAVRYDDGNTRAQVGEEHPGNQGFYNMAKKEYEEVKKYHPNDFVDTKGADMRELSCVK